MQASNIKLDDYFISVWAGACQKPCKYFISELSLSSSQTRRFLFFFLISRYLRLLAVSLQWTSVITATVSLEMMVWCAVHFRLARFWKDVVQLKWSLKAKWFFEVSPKPFILFRELTVEESISRSRGPFAVGRHSDLIAVWSLRLTHRTILFCLWFRHGSATSLPVRVIRTHVMYTSKKKYFHRLSGVSQYVTLQNWSYCWKRDIFQRLKFSPANWTNGNTRGQQWHGPSSHLSFQPRSRLTAATQSLTLKKFSYKTFLYEFEQEMSNFVGVHWSGGPSTSTKLAKFRKYICVMKYNKLVV